MTSDKIKNILSDLGYKLSDFGNHWRTNALYRGGKNPTALQIYKDSGVWVDYVKNSNHLPLESLIEATLQTNDPKIIKKVTGGLDFTLDRVHNIELPKLDMEKIYPESILNRLLPHYKFYNDKGISSEVLSYLRSGLATEGAMYQRYVFPIYNSDSCIHGFSGRNMSKTSVDRPKWKHMGKKSTWIYPYYVNGANNEVQQSIEEKDYVILVESIGDLLSLHEAGIKNVLVTFGTSLSSSMICFLVSLSCKKIVLSLNNDSDKSTNRGFVGALKSYLKLLNYFSKNSITIHLPTKNDFGDMSLSSIGDWLQALESNLNSNKSNCYKDKILSYIDSGEISKSLYKKKFFDG